VEVRRVGTIMASLRPIIAICGTTGVGKSKLAVELALRIAEGAAVINADSMQVYDGLDILTNKLPMEEMKGVPHFLMGFKKPGEQYVVGQWVEEATKTVSPTLSTFRPAALPLLIPQYTRSMTFTTRTRSQLSLEVPPTGYNTWYFRIVWLGKTPGRLLHLARRIYYQNFLPKRETYSTSSPIHRRPLRLILIALWRYTDCSKR